MGSKNEATEETELSEKIFQFFFGFFVRTVTSFFDPTASR